MCFCKIVGTNRNPAVYEMKEDVNRIVNYIADIMKSNNLIGGGNGIINAESIHAAPSFIAQQFIFVQDFKGVTSRRLYHIIISFDDILDNILPYEIKVIAEGVISMYSKYQSVYALHEDTRNYHLHILFNNISLHECKNLSYFINIIDISNFVNKKIEEYAYVKSLPRNFRRNALRHM